MRISGIQAAALLGYAGIIAGSFLPWAQAGLFKVNGTDGDGVLTLALGAIGFVIALMARAPVAALLAAAAAGGALAVGLNDANNIADIADSSKQRPDNVAFLIDVRVGTGLYLTIGSALVAVVFSILLAAEHAPENRTSPAVAMDSQAHSQFATASSATHSNVSLSQLVLMLVVFTAIAGAIVAMLIIGGALDSK